MFASAGPASFQHLGLLPDADVRAIRRAYARELKKIDQASDVAGFQQLRTAYETALACAEVQGGCPLHPDAPATWLDDASPDQVADAMADELRETLVLLAAKHASASDGPWQDALREALADERLITIEARQGFELRVALMLVQGWRPGHDALLSAAAAVFDWSRTGQLASLGDAGAIIDIALDERAMFENQAIVEKQAQRRVLRLLRQDQLPQDANMAQDIPFFMRMYVRFPFWLSIVAPADRITYWQQRCPTTPVVAEADADQPDWVLRVVFFCIWLVLVMLLQSKGMLNLWRTVQE